MTCSRPAVARRPAALLALVLAVLTLGLGGALTSPLAAQQAESEENPNLQIFPGGQGTLEVRGRSTPLRYARTPLGEMLALEPVVRALGGELTLGPLGQSYVLRLVDDEVIFGVDSSVLTIGQEIIQLSRPPSNTGGGVLVPRDFFAKTYGDRLGFTFYWNPDAKSLSVEQLSREIFPVEVDTVPISGVTTVVLRFSELPRYRVRQDDQRVELIFSGRLQQEGRTPEPTALVPGIDLLGDRLVIRLASDAEAAEPYDVVRGRRAQIVVDVSRRRRVTPSPAVTDLTRRRAKNEFRIVVDPGHGGTDDPGAVGPGGTLEKDLTLRLARQLQRRLEARLPVRVILTRDEDQSLPLATRTSLANENQADLFISLHINSYPGSTARGAETYFLDLEASDESAALSAEFENQRAAQPSAEDDGLQLILWDLAHSQHLRSSQRLASMIQQELNGATGLRDRGVKQAPFRVLMGANMPSVLVELGFLSNPDEEEKLNESEYRSELVGALVDAIARFQAGGNGASGGAP
ncbi:MAG: N-acetylmuramoyl-L-alanine amidase [Acidobacteriota bacterium]